MLEVGLFTVDKENVVVDTGELRRRLSLPKDYDVSLFDESIKKMLLQIAPRCCYVKTAISVGNGMVDFGFTNIDSLDLAKNLRGCKEAFVFAVTLGHQAERFLSKLSLLSPSEFFICDAIGSSLAESVCDMAEEKIRDGLVCKPRFSPGYGDFPLEKQKDVLKVLGAEKYLGITLTDANLMIPQKSITAILGILP